VNTEKGRPQKGHITCVGVTVEVNGKDPTHFREDFRAKKKLAVLQSREVY